MKLSSMKKEFKVQSFAGITLGGGKGRKTCLALIDYFPEEKKVFLAELYQGIEEEERQSGDTRLVRKLAKHSKNLKMVAVDAPLKLPKCMRCRLQCPGHEKCNEPEIRWMWKRHRSRDRVKRPNRIFTPYTERCVEQYIASEFAGEVHPDHALGSNRAPLAARAMYLKRRLRSVKVLEVLPKLSVWRLGQSLGMRKSQILNYRQLVKGREIRKQFLDKCSEQDLSFIYYRDFQSMVKDCFAFEAFIAAYTIFLSSKGLCEKAPKGFPKGEAWIQFPQELNFKEEPSP